MYVLVKFQGTPSRNIRGLYGKGIKPETICVEKHRRLLSIHKNRSFSYMNQIPYRYYLPTQDMTVTILNQSVVILPVRHILRIDTI